MRTRLPQLIAIALVATMTLGCDRGPKRARVHGKVTVGGQPITKGVVMFYPDDGRPAIGQIEPDGSYELTTYDPGDGALLGEHLVTIEALEVEDLGPQPKSLLEETAAPARPPRVRWLVPEQYADRSTSPLTATVDDKVNKIDFDL